MKFVFFATFVLLLARTGRAFDCPTDCKCVDEVVSCLCEDHDTVIFRVMFQFHVKVIIVDGCRQLFLPMAAMLQMDVDFVIFSNIDTIFVRPFALSGAERIGLLKIINVANFSMQPQAFSGLSNTENIILSNVSIPYAPKGSFGSLSNVNNFFITDSTFGEVDTFGISLINASSLHIFNTTFKHLTSKSFAVHEIGEVLFNHIDFGETMEDGITFQNVDKVAFTNCRFERLKTRSIYGIEINSLEFINSTFNTIESKALSNTNVKKIIFRNNEFISAEDGSLWPNASSSAIVEAEDNRFSCSINVSWMWTNEQNEIFLNTSTCIEDNKSLSSYAMQHFATPTHDNMIQNDENIELEAIKSHAAMMPKSWLPLSLLMLIFSAMFCSTEIA